MLALEAGGAEAVCAGSGQDALELLDKRQFDVVLLDVMMPYMDGQETLRRARAAGFTRPAIFVTARVLPEDTEALARSSACGVITKPYDPMTFATQVAQLAGLPFVRSL